MLYSAARGMWGQGTYFSAKFDFASTYAYRVTGSAADEYKGHGSQPVCQVLVADVLTGKHKMMSPNSQLKMPPEIEDANVAR